MSEKSKSQLQQELQELKQEKEKLMKAKTSKPDKFTDKQQERLNTVAEQIVDLEEQIELAEDNEPKSESAKETAIEGNNGYIPKPGTEKLVHVKLVRGRRFDENTGAEISSPYIQMFTYGEYKNFKKNASLIGYTIIEELYNPYKD